MIHEVVYILLRSITHCEQTFFFQSDVVSSVAFPKLSPPTVREKGNIANL